MSEDSYRKQMSYMSCIQPCRALKIDLACREGFLELADHAVSLVSQYRSDPSAYPTPIPAAIHIVQHMALDLLNHVTVFPNGHIPQLR